MNALRTLKAKTIVGATYFPPLNAIFARYLKDAGFTVRAMDGIDVPFDKVQELASHQVYAHIKTSFLRHKGADAIYMLGSGWRTLDIVALLEQEQGPSVADYSGGSLATHANQPDSFTTSASLQGAGLSGTHDPAGISVDF